MTKIISIKDLQTKTKRIREEASHGVRFVVVWRSKPIFEIHPFSEESFSSSLREAGLYGESFLKNMEKAENDLRHGKAKTYKNTAQFLKSLK